MQFQHTHFNIQFQHTHFKFKFKQTHISKCEKLDEETNGFTSWRNPNLNNVIRGFPITLHRDDHDEVLNMYYYHFKMKNTHSITDYSLFVMLIAF